jgi:YfiH family protein
VTASTASTASTTAPGSRLSEDAATRLGFSGRAHGNVSWTVGGGDVAAARAELLGALGLGPGDAVYMGQAHGGRVATVGEGERGRGVHSHEDAVSGVDALVTAEPGLGLVVLVADCVPVLLADPGKAVAAVHAGRGGVAAEVVAGAVAALSPEPARVVALVGPAIGGCCYEVPEAMASELAAQVPEAAARTSWGSAALDLPRAVHTQLRRAGVTRIRAVGGCTRCQAQRWFSHRAAPADGRQAGVIARCPAEPGARTEPAVARSARP